MGRPDTSATAAPSRTVAPEVATSLVTTGSPSTDTGTPTENSASGKTSPRWMIVAANGLSSTRAVIHDASGSRARAATCSGECDVAPTHHATPATNTRLV